MDWHDWMRNDKTLLALLMLALLVIWCFTRFEKLFDLIGTFQGALIALITGEALKRRNTNNGNQEDPQK
jgi:thiol:disulfide interchange protein